MQSKGTKIKPVKFEQYTKNYWISVETFNNSEFDYRLIIELIDMEEAAGESDFMAILKAVKTAEYAPEKVIKDIMEMNGLKLENVSVYDIDSYGLSANLTMKRGDKMDVLKHCLIETVAVNNLFGFYMDRPQNRIGNTGWDFLDGNIG